MTKSTELTPGVFERKLSECRQHLEALCSVRAELDPAGFTALELGTGWLPIITIGLQLCGAREIWSFDIERLLRTDRMRRLVELFRDYGESGKLQELLPLVRRDRLDTLRSLVERAGLEPPDAFLERLNIHAIVHDAQQLPLPSGSIDFFESSGVMEYIPMAVLRRIFGEFRRVASPRAVMSHRINLVDQFSCFDSGVTPWNFLKYSSAQWRWLDSPLIGQNRLRISDYRRLFSESGFDLCREESVSGSPRDLARVKLAPEFAQYSQPDLLVLHTFLTARVGRSSEPAYKDSAIAVEPSRHV